MQSLNYSSLAREIEVAIELAREAGRRIMDFYNSSVIAEEKIGLDNYAEPVTEADRAASQIIVNRLKTEFPADGILSEEETDDQLRLETNRVWMIDPIDGTRGFINHDGDFAVQIGLAIDGQSALGVVYEPFRERLFWAVKGQGAWLELPNQARQQLFVSEETDFTRMILAASRSHRSARMDKVVKTFVFQNEIQRGSVGVKIGLLVINEADVYIHLSPRTKQWDTCAPEIILREAGGMMTDLFGAEIVYNTPNVQNFNGVVSSNSAAHAAIIKKLKPLLTEFGRIRVKPAPPQFS